MAVAVLTAAEDASRVFPQFGLVGVASGQTMRIALVNVAIPPNPVCPVQVTFLDSQGATLQQTTANVAAGQSARVDLPGGAGRFEARAILGLQPVDPCRHLVPTLQVFDNISGRTSLVSESDQVENHGPPPVFPDFGLVGIAAGETLRANMVMGKGPPPVTPGDARQCAVQLTLVDSAGTVRKQISGVVGPTGSFSSDFVSPGFNDNIFLGNDPGARMELRPVLAAIPADPCRQVILTLEVFDTLSGRTSVMITRGPPPVRD
jgi:hypothetical protein